MRREIGTLILAAAAAAACFAAPSRTADPEEQSAAAPAGAGDGASTGAYGGVVDSIMPMSVMVERFQAAAGVAPEGLEGAASASRDGLVADFFGAVERNDASALRSLRVDVSEYAYLYFPSSHLAREPYRQPPSIGWMLTDQNSLKGEARVLRRFGGRPLGAVAYDCGPAPRREGRNALWEDCVIRFDGRAGAMRLFGTILERDGRFKFISLSNDL